MTPAGTAGSGTLAVDPAVLAEWVRDARQRTFDIVEDLSDEQLLGPRLSIVNPLLWEIGHVAWFQENWILRRAGGQPPLRPDGDALYDSAAIPHDTRWDLPLPDRAATQDYMREVRDRVLDRIARGTLSRDELYFILLCVFHEDMHDEAFLYTRQTLGYGPPRLTGATDVTDATDATNAVDSAGGPLPGDVELPGGTFSLGASADETFVFDNEKWAHPVELAPFAIARAAVTQAEFLGFVEDDGYRRRELWTDEGWRWREGAAAAHPVHWRREPNGGWQVRRFDSWFALEPHRPVLHVNGHEADAFCRWAGRRLPSEAEWEYAASQGETKRRFPWGEQPPTPTRACLDARTGGPVDVGALPAGDSASGCRQMIGNVWEWTASAFQPYLGFSADPYKEYSEPWFGNHRVLRGGCWATRSRLIRNTWRNFYTPDRRDVWAGFRTCRSDA
jgi:iron(II)-dependent oxidoreductase